MVGLSEARRLSSPGLGVRGDVQTSLAQARSGDAEAFHAIFDRYSKPILSFLYGILGNRAHAEEMTQETFVRAFRRLGSIRKESHLSTWLFGIARNVAREAIKAKYRGRRTTDLDDQTSRALRDQNTGPDERLIAAELSLRIQAALAALRTDQRTVFILKVLHKMRYEEISDITGSSIGKLKTDLHRARLEMRQRLGPYLGAEGPGRRGAA